MTQVLHELATSNFGAYIIFGELISVRIDGSDSIFHAAIGKKNIGGDDDVSVLGVFNYPVVGRIETSTHDFHLKQGMDGDVQPLIRDQDDSNLAALADFKNFVFDWAAIGVDDDAGSRSGQISDY